MKNFTKIWFEGENYTIGNILEFFIRKNILIENASFEMLHPLKNILCASIKSKYDINITLILIKIFNSIIGVISNLIKEFLENLIFNNNCK
mmetsp:Transcript_10493/g.14503  ORF Transcript_10493/g.14503 Transcript_10493/m.14503 type:complete len:91 (+) Transcript_10493:2668-2940(+)